MKLIYLFLFIGSLAWGQNEKRQQVYQLQGNVKSLTITQSKLEKAAEALLFDPLDDDQFLLFDKRDVSPNWILIFEEDSLERFKHGLMMTKIMSLKKSLSLSLKNLLKPLPIPMMISRKKPLLPLPLRVFLTKNLKW